MTRTKFDLLATNVINVILFVIIFCFGFIRWQKLEEVVAESNNSQERFRNIHSALINTVELTNLGEQVYGWTDKDVSLYKVKLAEAGVILDKLGGFLYHGKDGLDEDGHQREGKAFAAHP